MLGAVKDDGGEEQAPLFRVLARRWKSLAPSKQGGPAKRERVALPTADEQPKAARAWIAKPRQVYAHQKIDQPKRSWSPWLWMK